MAASYPGAIKNFSAIVNGVTKLVAALFNSPYDEITAIETELGTDVAGTETDLKTRLAVFLNTNGTAKVDVDEYGTSLTSPISRTLETVKICYGTNDPAAGTTVVTNLPFTAATSYFVIVGNGQSGATDAYVVRDSGAQFTITSQTSGRWVFWFAIGT